MLNCKGNLAFCNNSLTTVDLPAPDGPDMTTSLPVVTMEACIVFSHR
jgi:hypothetical protein